MSLFLLTNNRQNQTAFSSPPTTQLLARGVEPGKRSRSHTVRRARPSHCPQPRWPTRTEHTPGYLDAATQWTHSAIATPVQLISSREPDDQCELNGFV